MDNGHDYDGYCYHTKSGKDGSKNKWYCIKDTAKNGGPRCPGKLEIKDDGEEIVTVEHTCNKADHQKNLKKKLDRKLVRMMDEQLFGKKKTRLRRNSDNDGYVNVKHEDVNGKTLAYLVQAKTQTKEEKKVLLTGINSKFNDLKSFNENIKNFPEQLMHADTSLSKEFIQTSSEGYSLVLYDKGLLKKIKDQVLYIDDELELQFFVKGVQKFISLLIRDDNRKVWPVAWVLMTHDTINAYTKVWKKLLEVENTMKPRSVVCSFHESLHESTRQVFGVQVYGSFFSLVKLIIKQALERKIDLSEGSPNLKIVQKTVSTFLLPPAMAKPGLEYIVNRTLDVNHRDYKKLLGLLHFIQEDLLDRIPVDALSFFQQPTRVNSTFLAYQRAMRKRMKKHFTDTEFLKNLNLIEKKAVTALEKISGSGESLNETLKSAWNGIAATPPWEISRFLSEISSEMTETLIAFLLIYEKEIVNNNDSDYEIPEIDYKNIKYDIYNEALLYQLPVESDSENDMRETNLQSQTDAVDIAIEKKSQTCEKRKAKVCEKNTALNKKETSAKQIKEKKTGIAAKKNASIKTGEAAKNPASKRKNAAESKKKDNAVKNIQDKANKRKMEMIDKSENEENQTKSKRIRKKKVLSDYVSS